MRKSTLVTLRPAPGPETPAIVAGDRRRFSVLARERVQNSNLTGGPHPSALSLCFRFKWKRTLRFTSSTLEDALVSETFSFKTTQGLLFYRKTPGFEKLITFKI